MKNFFDFLIFIFGIFLISSESTRSDGHGEKKEVVEEKTEDYFLKTAKETLFFNKVRQLKIEKNIYFF